MLKPLSYFTVAMLWLVANVSYGITWDFEDPDGDGVFDDHGFILRGLEDGSLEDLPDAGSAWAIGKPNQFDGTEPIVFEGCHLNPDDDTLLYSLGCNQPFPYDPDTDSNDRGQSGYLDTYARSQWGDNLHTAINDQIATSPPILLPANAIMEVWSVGSAVRYFAPELEDASRKPEDESDGYVTGSSGVAVISDDDGKLLDSLLVASTGGTVDLGELDLSAHAGKVVRIEVVDAFAGGWGWLAIDEITIEGATLVGLTPGDFNGNGARDVEDMDLLSAGVTAGDASFDLDGDGDADADDRAFWVETLTNTYFGDSNFDGEFNSSDFVAVFTAAKYETGAEATWAQGDWNGDGLFNSGDFVTAFTGAGYEKGEKAGGLMVVPEPAGPMLWIVGMVVTMVTLRR